MPSRQRKFCSHPGCPEIVRGRPRCPRHTPTEDRPSPSKRGYTREWQRIRAAYLAAHPYCVECGELATEVDHKIRIRDGGTNDWENLQSFCKRHHSAKTARESGFGGHKA